MSYFFRFDPVLFCLFARNIAFLTFGTLAGGVLLAHVIVLVVVRGKLELFQLFEG